MTFQIEEISFEKAWRVIRAMQTDEIFDDWVIVVRFSCHADRKTIFDSLKKYNYPKPVIKKLKVPLPYCLLPRPNCFCLYDISLKNIYDLARSCSLFLQFEILFVDREKEYELKKFIVPEDLMYSGFSRIKKQVKQYFFANWIRIILILRVMSVKQRIITLFRPTSVYISTQLNQQT